MFEGMTDLSKDSGCIERGLGCVMNDFELVGNDSWLSGMKPDCFDVEDGMAGGACLGRGDTCTFLL